MPGHAIDSIISEVMRAPGEITLVAIGQLTNVAPAFINGPQILSNVRELVIMGGAARVLDNALSLPVVEWNVLWDPDAASIVFRLGIKMTMVGLDVTIRTRTDRSDLESMRRSGLALAMHWQIWRRSFGTSGTLMEARCMIPCCAALGR